MRTSVDEAAKIRPSNRTTTLFAHLLATGVLIGSVSVSHAEAQTATSSATAATSNGASHAFHIPSQPLSSALNAFGRQSGLQVTLAASTSRGITSHAVDGNFTPQQALGIILQGTGISFRINADRTAVIGQTVTTGGDASSVAGAIPLDTIDVQGGAANPNSVIGNLPPAYAGGQVATGGQLGMLGNKSVMDTPFNQTSYTSDLIKNQQAQTVGDVLVNDPSVTGVSTPPGGGVQTWMVRGFGLATSEISYGGMYGVLPASIVPSQLAERVEVLKGPNAFLNGMAPSGDVGGAINIVPKRAGDQPFAEFTPMYLSNGQLGGAVDAGQRFGDNKEFGVRFNGVYRDGDTAINNNTDKLGLGSLDLDYKGERLRVSANLGYQAERIDSVQAPLLVAPGFAIPAPPNPSSNFMQPWYYRDARDSFGVARGEYDITDAFTVYGGVGGRREDVKSIYTIPDLLNASGLLTGFKIAPLSYTQDLSAMAGVRGTFNTGPITHKVNFNWTDLQTDNGTDSAPSASVPSTLNIYNPVYVANPNVPIPGFMPKTSDREQSSLAASDTLSILSDRVQVTAGIRDQEVKADNYSIKTGAQTASYDSRAMSPFYGLVVKPLENVSLYANYIQGLTQGDIAPAGTANAGQVFAPYQTAQYETGVKIDWGKVTTTISAFQIAQPSSYIDPTTNTFIENGQQRNRGIEVNVFGSLTDSVRILGGVMLLNGVLVNTAGGQFDGNIAPGAPKVNLVLGGEWDTPFVHGLTLTGRAQYMTSQYYDDANTQSIPSWTRFDVGARYTFNGPNGKPITIRADINNVFDHHYWANAAGGSLIIGQPRTYLLSTTFSF